MASLEAILVSYHILITCFFLPISWPQQKLVQRQQHSFFKRKTGGMAETGMGNMDTAMQDVYFLGFLLCAFCPVWRKGCHLREGRQSCYDTLQLRGYAHRDWSCDTLYGNFLLPYSQAICEDFWNKPKRYPKHQLPAAKKHVLEPLQVSPSRWLRRFHLCGLSRAVHDDDL